MSLRDLDRDLVPAVIRDVFSYRIFGEADLQARTAQHLSKFCDKSLYVLNTPRLGVGMGCGSKTAKPDIAILDERVGLVAGFELKCFLDEKYPTHIEEQIRHDISALKSFGDRYGQAEYVFAFGLVNMPDPDAFCGMRKRLQKKDELWKKGFLRVEVVNVACNDVGRKRPQYERWLRRWQELKDLASRGSRRRKQETGLEGLISKTVRMFS